MIFGYVGDADGAARLARLCEGASPVATTVNETAEGARAFLWYAAPSAQIGRGARLGEPPLPFAELHASGSRLILTRGGFGGRPMYARAFRDGALASTDLPWLLRASRALSLPVVLEPETLATRAFHLAPRDTRSLHRDVLELPPGHHATLEADRVVVSRSAAPHAEARRASAMELREELLRAVQAATRSAGARVGVLAGGGVDSSALVSLARSTGLAVNAFAIDLPEDRPHLDALADALAFAPSRLAPTDAPLLLGASAAGLPLTWASAPAEIALLSRARTWGARTVLSGVFADACFDGSPEAASLALPRLGLRRAVAMGRAYDDATFATGAARVLWPLARRTTPRAVRALLSRARRRVRPPRRGPFEGPRAYAARCEAWASTREGDADIALSASARVERAFFSPTLALVAELRAQEEALSQVTRADPYLDATLATFAHSLRPDVVVGAGARRGLFREAIAGLVPESVRARRDKASFAPLHAALHRGESARAAARYARFTALGDYGVVDAEAAASGVARAAADPVYARAHGAALYALLSFEAWLTSSGAP